MVNYIYPNLPRNVVIRLSHPWSGDSQGVRKRFKHTLLTSEPATLTQSAETTIPSNYHKVLGLSCSKIKWRAT